MGKYKKRDYVTKGYIEEVHHYIYNDLDILDLYKDKDVSEFNQSIADRFIKRGEKYIRLEGDYDYVIITSLGRLINTKRITQYSIRFTKNTMVVYVSDNKIDVKDIFEQQGWDYDVKKILNRYKRFKWSFRDTTDYDGKYGY